MIGSKAILTEVNAFKNALRSALVEISFEKTGEAIDGFKSNPKIMTLIIGPIEHIAVIPKESLVEFLPPRTPAMPTPKAIKNGTVIGPVTTAPLSNDK